MRMRRGGIRPWCWGHHPGVFMRAAASIEILLRGVAVPRPGYASTLENPAVHPASKTHTAREAMVSSLFAR